MDAQSKQAPEDDGNQRRKSIAFAAAKTRRYSIGIPSSRKSVGEEGNVVPNYLRASTGSCHDFCKFGKKHEYSKSAVPVKFKATTVANKDRVTKAAVAQEKKKTTVKPSKNPDSLTPGEPVKLTNRVALFSSKKPQVSKQNSSTNGKVTKNELNLFQRSVKTSSEGSNSGIKTVKKTAMAPKTVGVNKVASKATLNKSQSPKASFNKAASLNTVKRRGVKDVSLLKDQNLMLETDSKQTIDDSIQTVEPEVIRRGVKDVSLLKDQNLMHETDSKQAIDDSIQTVEPEVKPETMEFDFIQPSMESINDPICNISESSSGKNVVEEESMIRHQVYQSSESDNELLEGSLTAPAVVESSQSCSDKEDLEEESSESFYDDEVLDGESEYTDDEVEVEVSDGSETVDVNEMEASVENHKKISRKGRMVISEEKNDKGVKLRFRRGKILDIQSENNGPRRLKFKRRVIKDNEDDQNIATRSYKSKTLDVETEINGPRKLKFTKGKVMEGKEEKRVRRRFEKKYVEEKKDSNNGPESVVLKHQEEQGKKDAQGLFNNVIEETASKLVESRKSKVKALVGAFETVISLQDGKS
ncbi:uncharacterized protein LOC143614599 [Bidens hawaiensis]|uniref:uncharacterized protein LOC143614599 n=1 Tax=Bidens hawaiensis TaxID=980011 RepID=UPI00404B5FBD